MTHWRAPSLLLLSGWLLGSLPACTVSSRGASVGTQRMDDAVRLEGTVTRVDRLPSPEEQLRQVAVISLQSSGKPFRVELAPGWFLEEQGLHFSTEQAVGISGNAATDGGEERIIAHEVTVGERKVRLRDQQGRPLWNEEEKEDGAEP